MVGNDLPSGVCERGGRVAYLLGLPVAAENNEILVFEVEQDEVSDDLVLPGSEPGRVVAPARR